ncbi:monosaccharide ABC transporter substrate-binding protein (CUT2 family) [Blastococcus colisei]|uniref:Monosaccharide ABC transporter substrate-binding protein (CUT2 family) n=1 Tax=Blastococcus colisei TaxID=1564162 RepID=A0A543PFL3_9ACTN|nr:substrate-binding domain-containing protein [Blastococcus colisei]TQN42846.1 monosaccharide ABC transporter substrate-binding protein (CUT2 family) [Blastococcus colisei]
MRIRRYGSTGAAVLAVSLLAACSSGTTESGSGSDGGAAADGPLAEVVADVEAASQAQDSFEVPSEPVDVSGWEGKTVYYVPITAQISVFQVYGEKIGEALGTVGADLQICDGGSNPSQISGCIDQAVGASAAAIITDNVPYGMAANALDGARAAGIPVLIANQIPDPAFPADDSLAYVQGPATEMITSVADWIVADSDGEATIVLQKVTDNPSTIAWAEAAEQQIDERCPDCTVVVNEVSASNFPLIPSSTSSAILANPDTRYVLAEFEHFVQPTLGGVQQTPNATQIKIVSSAATLSGLQMLADGGQLHADAGQNFAFQGWATADALFRLVAGQEIPEYDYSFRLFTQDNVDDLDLSDEGQASGSWYGQTEFADEFAALWGRG